MVGERVARLLEDRVEAGALLAARLILSAWVDAGAPDLPGTQDSTPIRQRQLDPAAGPNPPAATEPTPAGTNAEADRFLCASRGSKVFHYSDCHHVQRIKPEHLVRFESCGGGGGLRPQTLQELQTLPRG